MGNSNLGKKDTMTDTMLNQDEVTHAAPSSLQNSRQSQSLITSLAVSFSHLNPYLLIALALVLVFHGSLLFYTFKRTYDAYVHIFFADHYARAWFDHWDYRWYTGFTMTGYPPGSQQSIALLSKLIGLEKGFIVVQVFSLMMVVIGMYRFARVWVSERAAGYAALLTVFASSIVETAHVFGQLPTTFSLGFLLNALPFIYRWLREGHWWVLLVAWSVNAATTAGHHVTTLFGAVFFVGPVIVLALVEAMRTPLPDEEAQQPLYVTRHNLRPLIIRRVRRVVPTLLRAGVYGMGLIMILVLVVLPYWLWSRSDPITQVSIPHASRDSFILNPNAGLVFWLVPYGVSLIALPYVAWRGMLSKAWPLTLSIGLLFVLGTGGTTPIPRLLLGGAFDILTLDRFTFWATILMLPLLGEFVVSLVHGNLARYIRGQFGSIMLWVVHIGLVVAYLSVVVFTTNLTQFRRFQPEPISTEPIVSFLSKDEHWRWRYLTLGFGDQMAWLSAQTTATSVDGNYHSARRLPELTSTPVERLEGAKFRGIPGLGSLQQFLAVPDKYNLKYVFSNDQFYDPLLYFSGWHRLQRLENGIVVWEKSDIAPLPEVLPRKEIPIYQRVMWGIVPMGAISTSFVAISLLFFRDIRNTTCPVSPQRSWIRRTFPMPWNVWQWIDGPLHRWSRLPQNDTLMVVRWQVWLNWLQRIPHLQPVSPTTQQVRTTIVICVVALVGTLGAFRFWHSINTPEAVMLAYYDDLDFRRFDSAYERLDPVTKPSFEQYMIERSVKGGLVASYAKLDYVKATVIHAEDNHVDMMVETQWITSIARYTSTQRHTLVLRDRRWYIVLEQTDRRIPPDQFFRRGEVAWRSQERRRVTENTTAFSDVLDRPKLQVLSARLVRYAGRYGVVGELANVDVNPGDVTVTSVLFDDQGEELSRYNAQLVMKHKLLPKEITPFRIDFEGVAGAVLTDTLTSGDFDPNAFSSVQFNTPINAFAVYAKAVVTGRDLYKDVAVQGLTVVNEDGQLFLDGALLNNGTIEATIPQVLLTYYDDTGRVVWVDHHFVEEAVFPQRVVPFRMSLVPATKIETIIDHGDVYSNILRDNTTIEITDKDTLPLPPETGYAFLRVSVNYYVADNT